MKPLGAVLILIGLVLLLVGGLPFREKHNVAQIGDLKMSVTEEKRFTVPPLVSGIVILAGAALLFVGRGAPRV
jgi:hypothetical protein